LANIKVNYQPTLHEGKN